MINRLAGHNHPPRSERVKEIADRLRGTTGYNGDVDDIEDLTIEECKELDSQVFNCTRCNWWCDGEECNEHEGEWVCDECLADAS
jgi:hypothetical protein